MMGMIPIENSRQVGILVTSFISILIVTVSVGLRLVAKSMRNSLDCSDYCIIAASLWNIALHACCLALVTHGGFGFHIVEIYQRFGPGTVTFFFKGVMSFSVLWNATVCFSKLSVLSMYTAMIPKSSMSKWARILSALIIIWNIANIIAVLLMCRPFARNWDFTLPGTCGSQPAFHFAMGLVNLIADAIIIALPMPYLYNLRLAWRKKLAAMALLSIGTGTWAITICRQVLLPDIDHADMTYSGVLVIILSSLEPAVAIALPCIPLTRPLFDRSIKTTHSSYVSRRVSFFSKEGSRTQDFDPTATFSELVGNNDTSSPLELQSIKPSQIVRVSSVYEHRRQQIPASPNYSITVETKWEVRRD
ncbi:hypothetical protein BKA58DRAFT_461125 [Alternaria rosae]|uniref:uncharacterized protein n=1 Tax=Alternaria rosae TaxID=1187941 RepID=UPI001E8D8252|nr:uncharacterized protein BKA58DRAFT_461125 [Alternaria rosae]KAH6867157.1 hypothetical protein BKA58DRAFT_461125 [Alternaria rosae]